MNTPLIDCHSHSAFSGHGSGTVAQFVAQAQALGLAVYAQTEHLTLPCELDPNHEDSMSEQEALDYRDQLAVEQRRLAASGCPMRLLRGVEADWLAGRQEELERLSAGYDYVIGSVHFLEGLPLDNSDNMALWETYGVDGVWERYIAALEDMVVHSGPIRCLGHLDLPKVFGMRPSFDVRDAFGDLAALARSRELIVELNSAGWLKPAKEQYPSLQILELFCDAQVPCTVGCDAHKPQLVGHHVKDAYRVMHDAGYRHVVAPDLAGGLNRFELA